MWVRSDGSRAVSGEGLDGERAIPFCRALKHRMQTDLKRLFANVVVSRKHLKLLAYIA